MPRNSNDSGPVIRGRGRDPKVIVRAILGTLLAANIIAAGLLLYPPGGSAEDLARQIASLQAQLAAKETAIAQTREHTAQVAEGRAEGNQFLNQYFLPLRSAYSAVESELQRAAAAAKIKPKPTSYIAEPIEGSDTLQMMSITANYEGSYHDLLSFVHIIDQSPSMLIIESLSAVPQQGTNVLAVSMKINTFVRSEASDE
jgi:type IV pilus assembly protein PilO